MSAYITDPTDEETKMSPYDKQVWEGLNKYWQHRNDGRGLPNWASNTLANTGSAVGSAATAFAGAVPERVKEPTRRLGNAVADKTSRPTLEGAAALLELVNGTRVPVQSLAKALPFLGVLNGASTNSIVLGGVAADARRYCQTPLPV
ncbi:hypothetical protein [Paenarthrobacter sp. NPDC089316]|uniref:hypothetical protein n=1 Tax=unclassified Paenarthrobacter TaxID=2634190 RepID=UPI00342F6C3A